MLCDKIIERECYLQKKYQKTVKKMEVGEIYISDGQLAGVFCGHYYRLQGSSLVKFKLLDPLDNNSNNGTIVFSIINDMVLIRENIRKFAAILLALYLYYHN